MSLALVLAAHVADEALNDFLSFYNPAVESLSLPLPTFTFDVWIWGLTAAVVVLLALSPLAFRGVSLLLPLSYFLGSLMVVNGLGHLVASIYLGELVPGVYSSPLLLIAASYLLFETVRFKKSVLKPT